MRGLRVESVRPDDVIASEARQSILRKNFVPFRPLALIE
jgi:hypothetical protein